MTSYPSTGAPYRESGAETTHGLPTFTPVSDILETEDALILLIEMPGVEPSDVQIMLDKRVLSIAGRGRMDIPPGAALLHAEYRNGVYERAFTLSDIIDGDQIEATMKDGILRLTLPKMRPAPAKKITVKVAPGRS